MGGGGDLHPWVEEGMTKSKTVKGRKGILSVHRENCRKVSQGQLAYYKEDLPQQRSHGSIGNGENLQTKI